MTVYNLSTSLHRFVNERSADLFDGSRPCGFHCEEIAPWVAASYHGIFSRYHVHSVSEIQ